jgi:hypothetical protein
MEFVDDTTTSEMVFKKEASHAQSVAHHMSSWSNLNTLQLNPNKCK